MQDVIPQHTAATLPRYKCHKEVQAFKIREIKFAPEQDGGSAHLVSMDGGFFSVNAEYMKKHRPQIGGYFVLYQDGYQSFSPGDVFEDGYARVVGA